MNFTILTLFPEFIEQGLHTSILGKACEKGLLSFNAINIRDYSADKNKRVDDYTYGGGAGMLMQAQPVYDAYMDACRMINSSDNAKYSTADNTAGDTEFIDKRPRTIYVTPQGKPFSQQIAKELSKEDSLIFICGHYEGIDERVLEEVVTDRYSIGDYVLTGGELPALVMIDAISRLIPGVLGNDTSADIESFYGDLLEYPQYTRPEVWKGKKIPDVLLDGNPSKVNSWRLEKSIELTKKVRPDLYEKYEIREKVKKELLKDKRNNIHIIEALSRGLGDIVCLDPLMVYIPSDSNLYLCSSNSSSGGPASAENAVKNVISSLNIDYIITDEPFKNLFLDMPEFEFLYNVRNSVYTEKVHKKIRNKNIRKCTEQDLPFISMNYHLGNPEYIRNRIALGLMYGIFDENDNIAGFAGMHSDGSIGFLFIHENYRNKGYGTDMENFMINTELEKGHIPYGQIIEDNSASFSLQDKNGLYNGDKLWSWFKRV